MSTQGKNNQDLEYTIWEAFNNSNASQVQFLGHNDLYYQNML